MELHECVLPADFAAYLGALALPIPPPPPTLVRWRCPCAPPPPLFRRCTLPSCDATWTPGGTPRCRSAGGLAFAFVGLQSVARGLVIATLACPLGAVGRWAGWHREAGRSSSSAGQTPPSAHWMTSPTPPAAERAGPSCGHTAHHPSLWPQGGAHPPLRPQHLRPR